MNGQKQLNPCPVSHHREHLCGKMELFFLQSFHLCINFYMHPVSPSPACHCFSVTLPVHVLLSHTWSFSHTRPHSPQTHTHTHTHPPTHARTHAQPPSLFGCLCSTGSKSLAAACSSPNLPSLCTIALGTKLGPHNSRPARVNSRANTVKAKTHFLLSPTSPAKN